MNYYPPLLFGLIVAAYSAAFLIWWRSILRRRRFREERKTDFVKKLLTCFENHTCGSLNELNDLYGAYFSLTNLSRRQGQELSDLLRKAILKVASARPPDPEHRLMQHLELMRTLLKELEATLETSEKNTPFSGTPLPERQLLWDILEMTSADRDLIRTKLKQLADAIIARQDTIVRLGDEGRQSLKWAKWGLLGTVFFSLVSIALAIWK